jgi:UTP-glucose-1-phosphate uridylyltransferase
MSKTLVVMAAGAGSRFGGPKQTTPVGPHGEWLLEYAMFDAARAGFDRAVFIIRDELEPEFRTLLDGTSGRLKADLVSQRVSDLPPAFSAGSRSKPWGTGQAVLTVRDLVKTPFAIMNADDFYGRGAYEEGARACDDAASTGASTVVAMRLDRTLSPHGPVKRGWCQTKDGKVSRLEEVMGIERRNGKFEAAGKHANVPFNGSELVSMNYWVFPPTIFGLLGQKFEAFLTAHGSDPAAEFLLPEVVNELIDEGRLEVRAKEAPGPWFGLTYREDLPEAAAGLAELTRQGVYPDTRLRESI